MHIAEGILPLKQVLLTSTVALPIIATSSWVLHSELKFSRYVPGRQPFLMMAFALCFAVTLVPLPVPFVGFSSHLCATPLMALLFGLKVIPAMSALILLIQAIFFAHGGLTTLGANVLSLGVVGPSMTLITLWLLKKVKVGDKSAVLIAVLIGSLSVYFFDAAIIAWSFHHMQPFHLTFRSMVLGLLPIQGLLSCLEAIISAGVVLRLQKLDPRFVEGSMKKVKSFLPVSSIVNTIILLVFFISQDSVAASFRGVDEAIFAKTAESFGMRPQVILPWLTGEIELTIFSIAFLVIGFCAGAGYVHWRHSLNQQRMGLRSTRAS